MHINDVRNVTEYKRVIDDIVREDREYLESTRKSGFYWTGYQYDEKNQKADIKIRRVKNYSTANMYNVIAQALLAGSAIGAGLNSTTNNDGFKVAFYSGSFTHDTSYTLTGVATAAKISSTPSGDAVQATYSMLAGTDTTTVSTATMATLVSPASPAPAPSSQSITVSASVASLQFVSTWGAGSFGATGSTNIGEFGITLLSNQDGEAIALLNRLAVADNNAGFTSPINVNNEASYGNTITLVI